MNGYYFNNIPSRVQCFNENGLLAASNVKAFCICGGFLFIKYLKIKHNNIVIK